MANPRRLVTTPFAAHPSIFMLSPFLFNIFDGSVSFWFSINVFQHRPICEVISPFFDGSAIPILAASSRLSASTLILYVLIISRTNR
jgi:hypothetical protein